MTARRLYPGGIDKTVRLWDIASGEELRKFKGHSAEVIPFALSPDGKLALSGSDDGTARVWQLQRGERYFDVGAQDGNHLSSRQKALHAHSMTRICLRSCVDLRLQRLDRFYQSLFNPDLFLSFWQVTYR